MTALLDTILANRYEQKIEDIKLWLSLTEWNKGEPITENLISDVQNKMTTFNVINKKIKSEELIRNLYI